MSDNKKIDSATPDLIIQQKGTLGALATEGEYNFPKKGYRAGFHKFMGSTTDMNPVAARDEQSLLDSPNGSIACLAHSDGIAPTATEVVYEGTTQAAQAAATAVRIENTKRGSMQKPLTTSDATCRVYPPLLKPGM